MWTFFCFWRGDIWGKNQNAPGWACTLSPLRLWQFPQVSYGLQDASNGSEPLSLLLHSCCLQKCTYPLSRFRVTTDFKIKYMQMLCLPGGSGCVRSMSSQELAIYWRIGYCKSLPATQLSPDPAQAPQCPPSERWLRTAFFGQPPLCWVHQARPLNREPGPLPCGSFFLFRQQMC